MVTIQQRANSTQESLLNTLTNLRATANRNILIPDIRAPGFGKISVLFHSNTAGTLSVVINGIRKH